MRKVLLFVLLLACTACHPREPESPFRQVKQQRNTAPGTTINGRINTNMGYGIGIEAGTGRMTVGGIPMGR